jgi:hypothetical protein
LTLTPIRPDSDYEGWTIPALRARYVQTKDSIAIHLPKQPRQPRDVDGDPSRLVLREHLRLTRFGFVLSRVDVRERLPVGVPETDLPGR